MDQFQTEVLKNQIIEQTKTSFILHFILMFIGGLGLLTLPVALLINNHNRVKRLQKLNKISKK